MKPPVSVLIDTYNHERFIEQAIISVLDQDMSPAEMEVVVVDDGSTDSTPDIVRKFHPRVRYLRKENGGQASAFNFGIPQTNGEIVAFLDGDDWWAKGKLHRVIETMTGDPAIGMVGHGITESFETGRERTIVLEKSERLCLNSVQAARTFRLCRCYFGTSRLILRREIVQKILPVPETLVFEADEYLFTVAAALAECVILNEPLTNYRIHGGNLYLAGTSTPAGTRRKQRVLAELTNALGRRLPLVGVPKGAIDCVLEIVQAEAAQLRLMLDGGAPWETYQTERTIYRIQHGDASWKQRLFRALTMIPALVLPPRWFYGARRWLSAQGWYIRTRRDLLPAPSFTSLTTVVQIRK